MFDRYFAPCISVMHFAFILSEYIICLEYITITSSEEALKVCELNFFQEILTESSVTSEAVARRCSVKKVFLEILQNLQENTRVRTSLLIKLLKKKPWHRCFPVNLAKFVRTPFLIEHLRWLLLLFVIYLFNNDSFKSTFFMLNMAFNVFLSTIFVK